jgi:hypothetical protein
MPLIALNRTSPDHVVNLTVMPALLDKLVREPAGHKVPAPHTLRYEVEIAKDGRSNMNAMDNLGRRSVLSCPDCGGVMWEIDEDDVTRYRALEERVALARKLHDQAIPSRTESRPRRDAAPRADCCCFRQAAQRAAE